MTTDLPITNATWTVPAVERPEPPYIAGEGDMLHSYLDYHRRTLMTKCAGLDEAQLKTASTPPSTLTLLGLVRHMTEVERWWFRIRGAGQALDQVYCSDASPDGDFDDITDADPAADLAAYLAECAAADEAMVGRSLEDTFTHKGRNAEISLRWVYVHMIEEYARHNGHADLIRERIDGATGE
jgi:hypothetical protein